MSKHTLFLRALFANSTKLTLMLILPLFVSATYIGCSDSVVDDDHDHEEEEFEAVGVVAQVNGTEIVRVEDNQVTGSFSVGINATSSVTSLLFIDDHGDLETPEDEDFSLDVIVADPAVVEIIYDSANPWSFQMRGLKEGSTTIQIAIKHGGHNDFLSPEISLSVTP